MIIRVSLYNNWAVQFYMYFHYISSSHNPDYIHSIYNMDPFNSNVMTLKNQVLGSSCLIGHNVSVSEQATANTSTTSDNSSSTMLLKDSSLVGILNLTGDDMTLTENATHKAEWTVAWSTSDLNDDTSMVDLCVMYTISNSAAVITNLLMHAHSYYAVLIDGTGEHNLTDINVNIIHCFTDIYCSVCWRKVHSALYEIVKDQLMIMVSTSVNYFKTHFS